MKVEHHVRIHDNPLVRMSILAETPARAREMALAWYEAQDPDARLTLSQVEAIVPPVDHLIRVVYASPGDPAEVVMLCRDQLSLERLFQGEIQEHYVPGGLMVLTGKSFEQPFHGPPDRILRITQCLCFHLNDPLIICSCRNDQYSSVPAALEDFLVGLLDEAYMQADIVCNSLEKGGVIPMG